jgi:hypothetical protein
MPLSINATQHNWTHSVAMLCIMVSVIMVNVAFFTNMLSVIMLNVVMLIVLAAYSPVFGGGGVGEVPLQG